VASNTRAGLAWQCRSRHDSNTTLRSGINESVILASNTWQLLQQRGYDEIVFVCSPAYALLVAEFLAEMNKVMHEGSVAYKVPPASSDLAVQYLLLYSFSGAPDDFDSFITSDYRKAHMRIQLNSDSSHAATRLIKNMQARIPQWFPHASVEFAGTAYTIHRFSNLIINGQVQSLLLALAMILAYVIGCSAACGTPYWPCYPFRWPSS